MSLKAFHIVFVAFSVLLSFGVGGWMLRNYFAGGRTLDLALGILGIAAGVGLLWYGKVVLRKLKHIGYL